MKQLANIQINRTEKRFRISDIQKTKQWLHAVAKKENHKIESISYTFVSDEKLLEMNKSVLKHDYYTDIITFSLSDNSDIEGDIYISYERIAENANVFHVKRSQEIRRIMVHGLLHLCGFNDKSKSEKLAMTSKENVYLNLYDKMFHVKQ